MQEALPQAAAAKRNEAVKEILDELDAIHLLEASPERNKRTRSLTEKMDMNTTTPKEEKKAVRHSAVP